MTDVQRQQLREHISEQLLVIYQSVRPDISRELIDAALANDPTDEPEEGQIDELRVLDSELGDRELHLAHALEEAMRRIDVESFGCCIVCGEEIPFARLLAVPWALRCEEDEAAQEAPPPSSL